MSEDRTTPMRKPLRPQREPNQNEQETVSTEQKTPSTLPGGGGPAHGHGFVRTIPSGSATPSPFAPAGGPFAPGQPASAQDQTLLIRERQAPVFAWLVVVDGPDREAVGTVHTLQPGTTTIGRAPANHIVVRDDSTSTQHARIRIEGQEDETPAYILYDMGSSNGTYVGPKESYRAEANRTYRRALEDGEYLLLGETTFAFKKL